MERLTRYFSDWAHGAEGVSDKCLTGDYCRGRFEATAIVDRLAAIEDILGDTYDLARLRELVQADREGRCVASPFKPGDEVWVVERDGFDDPDCVSGYVFIAFAGGCALVHPYIGGCGELDGILHECLGSTQEDGECDVEVFPIEDLYRTRESAEQAMKEDESHA